MKLIITSKLALTALITIIYSSHQLQACEPETGKTSPKTEEPKKVSVKKFNKEDDFLIGFAKSDFVQKQSNADNEKTALIEKVALHGLHWFPKKGNDGDRYFVGNVTLDTPITASQYRALQAAIKKHGAEQVYVKFSATKTKEGTSDFQGKFLGYYVVTYEEREAFIDKLEKNREAPGFIPMLIQGQMPHQAPSKQRP